MTGTPITITTLVKLEGEITPKDLGYAVLYYASRIAGDIDDAGCDWFTRDGETFIANDPNWMVSTDPHVAALVDAANILRYGNPLKLTSNEQDWPDCETDPRGPDDRILGS